jgi:(1->4)-alpha-D-glucan 1-alpha-D-glucosylmutase
MTLPPARPVPHRPLATYRVQLHPGFTFDHLWEIVPALHALGVGDCYCSPIFRPTPGSLHGYDVCDYEQVNPEIGGEEGLRRLSARLHEHDMGLLLDFVPNHMGIDGPLNRWWRDVLRFGRGSVYADFFDIHWNDYADPGRARVFAPLLPEHYGLMLERGDLRVVFEDGALALAFGDVRLPLRPETEAEILAGAEGAGGEAILAERLGRLNGRPGDPSSFDELDRIIDRQHYRLARWQAGAHGTNYRRFFAIDTLVGLRMEEPRVFEAVHAKLKQLIREGIVTGLRIDHIDGLRDPAGYLERLQNLAGEVGGAGAGRFPVYVEKILAVGESSPRSWKAEGTTGYEFIEQLAGLMVDARQGPAFDAIYGEFTGIREDYGAVVARNKRLVLDEMFANTVLMLAQTLKDHLRVDRRWRDFTVIELGAAIRALLAGFAVYRTYRRQGEPAQGPERAEIAQAARAALVFDPRIEPATVYFVRDVLLGDYPEPGAFPPHRAAVNDWALTFQQYTGAVMAKAVEDTSYYTYNRLVALNEVGGDPGIFGKPPEEFHHANSLRLERAPRTLLTTSTHDTKMSEDVRARLLALSEIPWEWRAWIEEWRELNASAKTRIGERLAPDADEEYRLYQMLLGAWPLPPGSTDGEFRRRITAHLRKAVNEAKVNTSVLHPNQAWLEACDRFVQSVLDPDGPFLPRFRPAAERLSRLGMVNSLAQITLKLTVPGVPDIYQGNEAWDFSLVDPDNRRPIDHAGLRALAEAVSGSTPGDLVALWRTGGIKLALTRALLGFRREHAALFQDGAYEAVEIEGILAAHAIGFLRSLGEDRMLVLVPRLVGHLAWPPVGAVWHETRARPGSGTSFNGEWRNVATGAAVAAQANGTIFLHDAFSDWPVAVLHSRNAPR